jgi:hypothetical protein
MATYARRTRAGEPASVREQRDDLVNMMLLLQTMRDLLDHQKALARDLNQSLDKRVAFIRESVDGAVADMKQLRESVRQLARRLEEVRSETSRFASGRPGDSAPAEPDEEAQVSRGSPPRLRLVTDEEHEAGPMLQVLAKPEEPPAGDAIDNWTGLDFGPEEPDTLAFEIPDIPPERPGDAQGARQAFRALLDLESGDDDLKFEEQSPDTESGNGRSALHARVYEYSDAGMTVSQIAQELGIGKGEVRLILNLRRDRSR